MELLNRQTMIKSQQMIRSSDALIKFVQISEQLRKQFSEKLRASLSNSENMKNQIYELQQNKQLLLIQNNLVASKLNLVYESAEKVTNAKNLQDKHKIEMSQMQDRINILMMEARDHIENFSKVFKEKDVCRKDSEAQLKSNFIAEKKAALFER